MSKETSSHQTVAQTQVPSDLTLVPSDLITEGSGSSELITEEQLSNPDFWDKLFEDVVDSVRERIKRRTRISVTDRHISHSGRQKLGSPNIKGRVAPKKSRANHTQDHGRAKHGHDKSTKTQRR